MADDYWIKRTVKRKGSYRASVMRRYGREGFTRRGTIKQEILLRDAKKKGKIGKRARLALTLRKLRR